jgi:hypothetical protein
VARSGLPEVPARGGGPLTDEARKIGEADHDRIIRLEAVVECVQREIGAERTFGAEALELAREEIERRLLHLNGETARMTALQNTLVGRELYEANMAALRAALAQIEATCTALSKELSEMRGKLWLPMISFGAGVTALVTGLVYLLVKP